jgi:hypothetical protein
MRSTLAAAASAIILSSIVFGIVAGILVGQVLAEAMIHFGVGLGFVLLAPALFDFRIVPWLTRVAAAASFAFGSVFLLQGVADLVGNADLHYVAFQVLGQGLERILPNVLLIWFAALLLTGSAGRSRWLGWAIVPLAIGLEVGAAIGFVVGIEIPFLKLHLFAPLVWLIVESVETSGSSDVDRSAAAGRRRVAASIAVSR